MVFPTSACKDSKPHLLYEKLIVLDVHYASAIFSKPCLQFSTSEKAATADYLSQGAAGFHQMWSEGEKWKVEALCAQELREQARFSAFCKGNRCAAQQAWGHFLPRALAQMEQYIKECVLISAQVQTELELSLLIFCSGKLCWVL